MSASLPPGFLPGRLSADEVFPAGAPGHRVHWLDLPGGERARAVVCDPPPARGGTDAPDDAPAVVCVHGWGCSAYSFRRVLRPVADLGARAAAPDLRGHGWSSKPLDVGAYTPAALAAWLAAALDALGIARAVLVGHSLGGMIALQAALDRPERVAALVLVAPLGLSAVGRLRTLRWLTPPAVDAVLPRLASRALVRQALALSYGDRRAPHARDVDEYWAPTADPALARATRLVVHAADWGAMDRDALARVRCPAEVLLGARDNLIAERAVRPLVAALPRGVLEVIPGVGHVPAEEAPERVVAAVARALAAARTSA